MSLKRLLPLLFVLLWLACGISIYNQSKHIVGPFIFGDELSYFDIAKNFSLGKQFLPTQYPPLYSLALSVFLDLDNLTWTYDMVKIFNAIVFSLSVFPLFLLCQLVFAKTGYQVMAAAGIILLPWSSLTAMVWAEPLFYFIYSWILYLVLRFFQEGTMRLALILSGVISAAFLTKQAGILPVFAIAIVFGKRLIFDPLNRRKNIVLLGTLLGPISMVAIGYSLYGRWMKSGVVGYGSATSHISSNALSFLGRIDFYSTIFYQLAYASAACFLIFMVLTIVRSDFFRRQSSAWGEYASFLLLVLLGISVISSFFYNSFEVIYQYPNEIEFANGRYIAPLLPGFILVGFKGLEASRGRLYQTWFFWVATIFCSLIIYFFSPLNSVRALGVTSAQDMTYWAYLLQLHHAPWSLGEAKQLAAEFGWLVPLVLFGCSMAILALYRWTPISALASVILIAIYASSMNSKNIRIFGEITGKENELFRSLLVENIPLARVYLKKGTDLDQNRVLFWLNGRNSADDWREKQSIVDVQTLMRMKGERWFISNENQAIEGATRRDFGRFYLYHFEQEI